MKFIMCRHLGHKNCKFVATGEKDEEILREVFLHLRKEHPQVLRNMSVNELIELRKNFRQSLVAQ